MTKQEALPVRFFIGLFALTTLVAQLVVVPRAGATYAGRYPEVAYLEPLYVTALMVALIGLEIALLSAWQLVSAALTDRALGLQPRRWTNIMAASLIFMTAGPPVVRQDAPMGNGMKCVVAVCTALLLAGCSFPPSFSDDEKLEMRNRTSEYQQVVLEDLVVTESEYRDAVDATRNCVQDKGWGVGPVTEQDGNQLGFQSSYSGATPPGYEEMQACEDEFMSQVGPIWVSQRTSLTNQQAAPGRILLL